MGGVQLLRNQLVLMSSDLYLACLKEMGVVVPADTVSNATATDSGNSTGGEIPTDEMLRCFSRHLSPEVGSREFSRTVLLVYAAALVFFMQAGFAMVCAGAVRKKNVQNTMLKNLLDACGAAVAYFVVGYAFAFGGMDLSSSAKTFVGNRNFFLMDVDDMAFWLFQYAFSAASATIVAGTLAERCQMAAYLCYSAMLAGWVYPIVAHAVWNANGFLSAYSIEPLWGVGMLDFAGSGVVHLTGGTTALFATIILGPRRGRFHDETGRKLDHPRDIVGHSPALQMLGTFILWFGWYGFNCGSALLNHSEYTGALVALAGVNTTIASGAAALVALFANLWYLERTTGEPYFDVKFAMNGCLSGLVAITAGCGFVEPWAAFATGIIAGLLYMVGSIGLVHLRLDDAVDAIPVHMINGAWGLISVGFFASPSRMGQVFGVETNYPGWFYNIGRGEAGNVRLLGVQLIGLIFICSWVMVIMLPFFVWLDWKGWFRSDPLEEIVGLDTSYHGGLALLNSEDAVNPEYITAFQLKRRQQGNLRRRNPRTNDEIHHEMNGVDRSGAADAGAYRIGDSDAGATPPIEVDEEEYQGGGNEDDDEQV